MTYNNERWKRHYPLLLLAALQAFGILLCVVDLYRRQHILQRSLEGGGLAYAVSRGGDRTPKERCLFLMSFLPNTCDAGAAAFTLPLR